jgi:hypothetical protein
MKIRARERWYTWGFSCKKRVVETLENMINVLVFHTPSILLASDDSSTVYVYSMPGLELKQKKVPFFFFPGFGRNSLH